MLMSEKNLKRRFSLEDDFMNYNTNDLLFGYLRVLSTIKPENGHYKEYLLKSTIQKNRKQIKLIIGSNESKTFNNQFKKLEEKGLIAPGVIKINGEQYDCYYFPYDKNMRYKILEKSMVEYLVNTASRHVIRVYLYLLNKYNFKPDGYIFTIKEIASALGYSDTTKSCNELIRDCLYCLSKQGIINIEEVWQEVINPRDGGMNKTQRLQLNFVASSREDF